MSLHYDREVEPSRRPRAQTRRFLEEDAGDARPWRKQVSRPVREK
jgi:hypothetical protein